MLTQSKRYTAPGWGSSGTTFAGSWTVERMRRAIQAHDNGYFAESYAAAEKVTQWAIPFGAIEQRLSPSLRFPRVVEGGTEGLDAIARREAEALFVGSEDELAPAFPSAWWTLWNHAMMGFCWWQTVFEPTPNGSMLLPRTTIWPSESTYFDEGRNTWVAITLEEGLVDIDPRDPRWTLIGEGDKPWLSGGIRAIGNEFVEAIFTKDERASYSDEHGRPKPFLTLPAGIKIESEEGKAAFEALKIFYESEAGAVFQEGTKLDKMESSPNTAMLMKDILELAGVYVAIVVLGTDGTMNKGTGGVYTSPTFEGVAASRVAADVKVLQRGANRVLSAWRDLNYTGLTVRPRAIFKVPDLDRDARTKSYADRMKALHETIKAERDNGCEVTQERVNDLALQFDVSPPILAGNTKGAQSYAYDQQNGVITINQRLAELGLPADTARGHMTIPEYLAGLGGGNVAAPSTPAATP